MNTLRKSFVIGMTVIGLGTAAFSAQAAEPEKPHPYAATKFDPAKHAERFEQRHQKLHDALKLNANQETAWKTYMNAIKPQGPQHRAERVAFKDLNTPQRMEKSIEFGKARLQQQENRLAALKTFYAALTPDQQKIFDLAGDSHGRGHRGPGMYRRG